MSQQQRKEGTGVLFPNDRKDQDSQPDYRGRIKDTEGTERWLVGWKNQGQHGEYIKVSMGKPVEETAQEGVNEARQTNGEQPAQSGGPGPETGGGDDFSDDVPFVTSARVW